MKFLESNKRVAGFSLVELMVVVSIIAALAVIGMPRFRTMLARARQAEAKTNLEQLHKLNTLYQTAKDRYAAWAKTNYVGYTDNGGTPKCNLANDGKASTTGTCFNCTTASHNGSNVTSTACTANPGCQWKAARPGAKELGFLLSACTDWRYRYWIQHTVIDGKEHYHAVAYSPSDPDGRIFPTCDGSSQGGTTRNTALTHPTGNAALTVADEKQGDVQAISEDKIFAHSDVVAACE